MVAANLVPAPCSPMLLKVAAGARRPGRDLPNWRFDVRFWDRDANPLAISGHRGGRSPAGVDGGRPGFRRVIRYLPTRGPSQVAAGMVSTR